MLQVKKKVRKCSHLRVNFSVKRTDELANRCQFAGEYFVEIESGTELRVFNMESNYITSLSLEAPFIAFDKERPYVLSAVEKKISVIELTYILFEIFNSLRGTHITSFEIASSSHYILLLSCYPEIYYSVQENEQFQIWMYHCEKKLHTNFHLVYSKDYSGNARLSSSRSHVSKSYK